MSSATTTRLYQPDASYIVVSPRIAAPLTETEKNARSTFVNTTLDNDKMAALIAEKKRIDETLKEEKATRKAERDAARANQPGKLEREIARQEKSRPWLGQVMADMVQARVKCGQSREEAIDAILAVYRERVNEALAQMDAEAEAQALLPAQPVAPIALVAHKAPKATKAAKASN